MILWIMNVHTKSTVMFKYHSLVIVCVGRRSKKLFKLYDYMKFRRMMMTNRGPILYKTPMKLRIINTR